MKKRWLLVLIASFVAALGATSFAFGSQSAGERVEVDEVAAAHMGERFFDSVMSGEGVVAGGVVKYYDVEGDARGYIVHAYRDGTCCGYVVFDSGVEFGILEYGIGEDSVSPCEIIEQNAVSMQIPLKKNDGKSKLVQLDSLTYCLIDSDTGEGITNYGERESVYEYVAERAKRSSSPITWDDEGVFFAPADVYRNYNVDAIGTVSGYTQIGQSIVMMATGRYACAVSAMLTVCSYYVDTGGMDALKDNYLYLWEKSGTVQTSVGENGVIFGGTSSLNRGAVCDYCATKGAVVSERFASLPTWSDFKSCIDSQNMAIIGVALKNNPNSAHAMAVSGYSRLVDKTNQLNVVNIVLVCDGWYTSNRFFNFNPALFDWYNASFYTG